MGGIAHIHAAGQRNLRFIQNVMIGVVEAEERLVCRDDHPGAGRFRHGDIGPPVHVLRFIRAVFDAAAQVQGGRILPHPRADGIGHAPDALEFIQPQHLALGSLIDRRVHRRAGQRIVALDAHVELHAAAEPGVAQPQIARLKHRIDVQQLLPAVLIIEGIQPSAQLRQKHGAHVGVFHHRRLKGPGLLFPVVAVLQPVGQHGRNHALTDVFLFFLRHLVRHFIPGVNIADVFDVRHGIQRPHFRRRDHELFQMNHGRLSPVCFFCCSYCKALRRAASSSARLAKSYCCRIWASR